MAGGQRDLVNGVSKMMSISFSTAPSFFHGSSGTQFFLQYGHNSASLDVFKKLICFELIESFWMRWKDLKSQHLYCLAKPVYGNCFLTVELQTENPTLKLYSSLSESGSHRDWDHPGRSLSFLINIWIKWNKRN